MAEPTDGGVRPDPLDDDARLADVSAGDGEDWPTVAELEVIRQRLVTLPRPALPDTVRARLDAAIAAEAALRPAPVHVPAQTTKAASTIPAPRQRRRSIALALIGTAAAFALFAAVDPFATSPPSSDDLIAGSAQPEASGSFEGNNGGAGALAPPASWGLRAVLVTSGMQYTAPGLGEQAASVLATASPGTGRTPLDIEHVRACVSGITAPGEVVLVDMATFEGRPAIIVVHRSGDTLTITAHEPTCTASDSATITSATAVATSAP